MNVKVLVAVLLLVKLTKGVPQDNMPSPKLKYAFLQPDVRTEDSTKNCPSPQDISAFQFLNFAIAAGTLAINLG